MDMAIGLDLALAFQPAEVGGSRTSIRPRYALLAATHAARAGQLAVAFGLCLCAAFAGNGARRHRLDDRDVRVCGGMDGLDVALEKVLSVEGSMARGTAKGLGLGVREEVALEVLGALELCAAVGAEDHVITRARIPGEDEGMRCCRV